MDEHEVRRLLDEVEAQLEAARKTMQEAKARASKTRANNRLAWDWPSVLARHERLERQREALERLSTPWWDAPPRNDR